MLQYNLFDRRGQNKITRRYNLIFKWGLPNVTKFCLKVAPSHTEVSFLETVPNFHPWNFHKLECMISEQLIGNFLTCTKN